MRPHLLSLVAAAFACFAAACSGEPVGATGASCTEGFVAACSCADGTAGEAACENGIFLACDCSGGNDIDATSDVLGFDASDGGEDDIDAGPEDTGCGITHSYWPDIDGDGFGDEDGTLITVCERPPGYADNPADCNDEDNLSYPGATELCDEVDNDCDALVDEEIADVPQWIDADTDGFGDPDSVPVYGCGRLPGRSPNDNDCNDENDVTFPGATDICDSEDNDCDTRVDEDATASTWWVDLDLDGYGDEDALPVAACAPLEGYAENRDDCDDENELNNPDGEEVCDLADNDCDGIFDEGTGLQIIFADSDSDGWGDAFARPVYACESAEGFVTNRGDCDDLSGAINPTASEVCDGVDNDCDGNVDDLAGSGFIFYADADGDSYGNASNIFVGCAPPLNFVASPGDCDDRRSDISPDSVEVCDGLDNDCNSFTDEGVTNACGGCGPTPSELCGDVQDNDCDGVIDEAAAGCFCDGRTNQPCYSGPAGTLGIGICRGGIADCACPGGAEICSNGQFGVCEGQVVPQSETCDGIDNDCDGLTDEALRNACGDCGPEPLETCDGIDNDCDGLTDEGLRLACGVCPGDEADSETCGDALDNDCDGFVDETCACVAESEPCYPGPAETLGVGACVAGARLCYAGTEGPTQCTGAVLPTVETCNDIDDDCDGQVDVAPDGCLVCGTSAEVCDSVDNDCDGQIDEGLRNGCGLCLAGISPEEAGGSALCDGLDNDCDGLIDEELLNACGVCDGPCYTLRWDDPGDFSGGEFDAVSVTPGGLVLNTTTSTYSDLWIANAGSDSVSRINTSTGTLVGTYPVGVNGGGSDDSPSRTAVDFDGNAWVANRAFGLQGSVTKIRGQDCVTNCVLFNVAVGGVNGVPRALAVDRDGYIWVGNYNELRAYRLDPDTGATLNSYNIGINPYGFAIDRTGILWIATISGQGIGAFDIASGTMIGNWAIPGCSQPYGITIDGAGNVWTGNWQCDSNDLVRLDRAAFNESPRRIVIESFAHANLTGTRGVAVDGTGDVWVAASNTDRVGRFDPDTRSWVGTYPVCGHPTGVGIANDGNIWAACNTTNNSNRLRPDGAVIGTVGVGAGPYSYSDLTGFQLRNFTARQGYFRKVFDCGFANCSFDRVSWTTTNPAGTTVTMRFRTSADGVVWTDWTLEYAATPADIAVPLGRYLQAEIRMTTTEDEISPTFTALDIAWQRP